MNNNRMVNSVRSLLSLYTVVIGIALSLAVVKLVDPEKGIESLSLQLVLQFIAFIATLFPFYHGALRHIDESFVENRSRHIKPGALIVDFFLLFLHALVFVVLSLLLKKPAHFAWVLSAILSIDVVWAVFAHFGSSASGKWTAAARWGVINLIFVGVIVTFLYLNDYMLGELVDPLKVTIPTVIACLVRTLVDYIWCSDVYFPSGR